MYKEIMLSALIWINAQDAYPPVPEEQCCPELVRAPLAEILPLAFPDGVWEQATDEWKEAAKRTSPGGFYNRETNTILINDDYPFNPMVTVEEIIVHEMVHFVQAYHDVRYQFCYKELELRAYDLQFRYRSQVMEYPVLTNKKRLRAAILCDSEIEKLRALEGE